jgi:hypothetical protein
MRRLPTERFGFLILCVTGITVSAGCTRDVEGKKRFTPSESKAQATLEMALEAWQKSGEPGQVQESGPAIHLVDSHHKTGQKLAAYSILGTAAGDADRVYAVQLTFDSPHQEIRVRFVVFGNDPMWVVRYEDYEMITHWDHPQMESSKAANDRPTE